MSNALSHLAGFIALPLAEAPAPPAGPKLPDFSRDAWEVQIGLLALGLITLTIWLIRRIHRPQKLLLTDAPGRANRLHPGHIVLLFVIYLGGGMLLTQSLSTTEQPDVEGSILANTISRSVVLLVALVLGHYFFRHGLRRGMGLSLRHWGFDSLRAVVAYLAVYPVCMGLQYLSIILLSWLWPEGITPHPVMEQLRMLSPAYKALIIFGAVVLAALFEEVFFRGLLQSMLRRFLQPWGAILLTSALFALMHGEIQNLPALFALSVVLGYNYERTGRLLPSILLHAIFNAVTIGLFLMN